MTTPIMRWFDTAHVSREQPARLAIATRFEEIAHFLDFTLSGGPEKSTALRKLLEAKDAAVRQAIADGR